MRFKNFSNSKRKLPNQINTAMNIWFSRKIHILMQETYFKILFITFRDKISTQQRLRDRKRKLFAVNNQCSTYLWNIYSWNVRYKSNCMTFTQITMSSILSTQTQPPKPLLSLIPLSKTLKNWNYKRNRQGSVPKSLNP